MLERLDKIDGVQASSANHTGTLIRITVKAGSDRENVTEAVRKDLADDKRTPTRLDGDELAKALKDEVWRDIARIGELSATEFRKLTLDRVKEFSTGAKLDKEVASKLLKLAEGEWDRLAKAAQVKDGNLPPHKADWTGRCGEFAKALVEQSKELLTADQRARLRKELENCVKVPPGGKT